VTAFATIGETGWYAQTAGTTEGSYSRESFLEDDTNTFLSSIDDQLAYIGGFVSINNILSVSYNPSPWEFAYLGGTTITDRANEGSPYTFAANIAAAYGSLAPDTDSATPNGLPGEEVARLGYFAGNYSTPDGAARSAPPDPTATLVGLAAAWRSPSDVVIPCAAGSEGTGGGGGQGTHLSFLIENPHFAHAEQRNGRDRDPNACYNGRRCGAAGSISGCRGPWDFAFGRGCSWCHRRGAHRRRRGRGGRRRWNGPAVAGEPGPAGRSTVRRRRRSARTKDPG